MFSFPLRARKIITVLAETCKYVNIYKECVAAKLPNDFA